MANNEVVVELDVELEMQELLLIGGDLASRGAEYMVDELKRLIPRSDIPSEPGQPPHSSGRLLESLFPTRPKLRKKANAIIAYAWSKLTVGKNKVPLLLLLDQGFGPAAPRPVLEQAAAAAQKRLDVDVARVNQELRQNTGS